MGYSFMRFEKIKTLSALGRAYNHNYRVMDVPNADKEKQYLNEEIISLNGKTYTEAFQEKVNNLDYYKTHNLHAKGIIALEVVTSFSREDLNLIDLDTWKQDNATWLRSAFNADIEKYGDNVISMVYHGDEAGNVHCHAIIIPVNDKGKICADYYIGGRKKCIELQDSYGKYMQINHGLERGLHHVRANHEDIKHFYAEINSSFYEKDKLPAIEKDETLQSYKEKMEHYVKDLKGSHLRKIKELEREITKAEAKADRKNEKLKTDVINLRQQVRYYKKEKESMEHEFGNSQVIRQKLVAIEALNYALNNYPEEDQTAHLIEENNKMILWGKKQKEKEQRKEKKKDISLY